jgi:hypothetical protein
LITRIALPAYAILLTVLHHALTDYWWLASPDLMVEFEAAAPFQYRVLLPALVAVLHALTAMDVDLLFMGIEVAAWMVLLVLGHRALTAFGIGGAEVMRRALALTLVIPLAVHLMVPDLRALPVFEIQAGTLEPGRWHVTEPFRYVYDLPAAVFVLGLLLILRRFVQAPDRRWFAVYLGVFALATVNRETTIFLIPAFAAICWERLERPLLAGAVAAQLAVVVVVQGFVHVAFSGNVNPHASVPGTSYENHFIANLALLSEPMYLLTFLVRFGVGLYLPVLLLRRYLDPFLGRSLLWFGLPFIVATLVFGRIQEHRVMLEIVPLLWLAAVQALAAASVAARRQASPEGDTSRALLAEPLLVERRAS